MPPRSTVMASQQIDLQMSEGFIQGLDQLAAEEDRSRAEVVRRAVALLAFAKAQQQRGRRLGFFSTDDNGHTHLQRTVSL